MKYTKEITITDYKCPICLINKDILLKTFCNHKFCKECAISWFSTNKKCPVCMTEINKE